MEFEGKKKSWKTRIKNAYIDIKERFIGVIIIAVCISLLWIVMHYVEAVYNLSFYNALKELPNLHPLLGQIFYEIQHRTVKGIFFFYAIGSIFFFPFPLEVVYIQLLKEGNAFGDIFPIIFAGLIIGHNINYFLGRFLGVFFKTSIKKKTRKKINYFLKKYGGVSIFLFNALPLPSPLFNFCAGLFRYPYLKWLPLFLIGQTLNYVIIYYFWLWFL